MTSFFNRSCSNPLTTCVMVADYLFKPFFKKRGEGKGDWGSPGDEMIEVPLKANDPCFDSECSEAELQFALLEHMYTREEVLPSPVSVTVEEGHMWPTVDCDVMPVSTLHSDSWDSPKGSWAHSFAEPTHLKLPDNAVWPLVPDLDISAHSFFE